jgi:hypothetical protein
MTEKILPGSEVEESNFRPIFGHSEIESSGSAARKSFKGKIHLQNSEPIQDSGQCSRRIEWLQG